LDMSDLLSKRFELIVLLYTSRYTLSRTWRSIG
jgi:hypothetical protein